MNKKFNNRNNESREDAKKRYGGFIKDTATGRKTSFKQKENKMSVFVVVTHYMYGKQAEQIFASEKTAKENINNRKDESGSPTIEEFSVEGEKKSENHVFIAGSYDRANDIHNLVGIYGNYDDAKKAAVEHGIVSKKEIK